MVASFISKLSFILFKNSHYVLKVILLLINCNLTFLYVPLFYVPRGVRTELCRLVGQYDLCSNWSTYILMLSNANNSKLYHKCIIKIYNEFRHGLGTLLWNSLGSNMA